MRIKHARFINGVKMTPYEVIVLSSVTFACLSFVIYEIKRTFSCRKGKHLIKCPCGKHFVLFEEKQNILSISFDGHSEIFNIELHKDLEKVMDSALDKHTIPIGPPNRTVREDDTSGGRKDELK